MDINTLWFLDHNNFGSYNRILLDYLDDLVATCFLSELISKYKYHHALGELISHEKYGDGWMYFTADKIQEKLKIKRHTQEQCIDLLVKLDLIEVQTFGFQQKKHFRPKIENILSIHKNQKNNTILQKPANKFAENDKLVCGNQQTAPYIYKKEEEKELLTTTTASAVECPVVVEKKLENLDEREQLPAGTIIYHTPKGEPKKITETEIYTHFIKLPYPTGTVKEAISILRLTRDPITNPLRFLEGVCKNLIEKNKIIAQNIPLDQRKQPDLVRLSEEEIQKKIKESKPKIFNSLETK